MTTFSKRFINSTRKKKHITIVLDGRSGSGKSSLTEQLKQMLPNSEIIHLDQFDLYQGDVSIQRVISEVLEPLSQETNKIVILEGIFALSKDLEPYYDYKIWIDCPKNIGFARGLKRDISFNDIDNSEKWLNYWLPKEEAYISSENPQKKADIVIDGTV